MSGFEFDASDFISKMTRIEARSIDAAVKGMSDSLDDLERIASNIAPIKSSILRKSSQKTVGLSENGDVVGELTFNAVEKRGGKPFNYAYWIHEMDYNLGERSAGAPGTDGYSVGNKYVERPLKGESERYVKEWAQRIARGID